MILKNFYFSLLYPLLTFRKNGFHSAYNLFYDVSTEQSMNDMGIEVVDVIDIMG
jgi:hypothetical protein